MLAGGEIAERIGARAEIVVRISEVGLGAVHANLERTGPPALADARVQYGGFLARVRADDQQRVGLVDAGDGRIEDVGGSAGLRIEGGARLGHQIDRATFRQQFLERKHLFHSGEVSSDGADPLAVDAAVFAAMAPNASDHDAARSSPFSLM